ncbi:MAG TPA: ribonuclease P protein subunit [Nanoarchaeota archaeon]|nr:ribonuclease P protein subunit [Nanoarchaeota archaeon]
MTADILRHELIGLEIEVVTSPNSSLVGIKGKIIDETRNTLRIQGRGKVLTIMKNAIVFRASIGGRIVEIDGSSIMGRPEDRIKK